MIDAAKRFIYRILLIGSVLILLAAPYFWLRSHRRADALVAFGPSANLQTAVSHRGRIYIAFTNVDFGHERAWSLARLSEELGPADGTIGDVKKMSSERFSMWGFLWSSSIPKPFGLDNARYTLIAMPYWPWIILGLPLPLAAARRRWTLFDRRRKGLCLICGYDLRATPNRCPECGTEPAAAPTVSSIVAAPKF